MLPDFTLKPPLSSTKSQLLSQSQTLLLLLMKMHSLLRELSRTREDSTSDAPTVIIRINAAEKTEAADPRKTAEVEENPDAEATVMIADLATVPTTDPATVLTTDPAVVPTTDPATVLTTDPAMDQTTAPDMVLTTDPAVVPTTDPATVLTTDPAMDQTTAPDMVLEVTPHKNAQRNPMTLTGDAHGNQIRAANPGNLTRAQESNPHATSHAESNPQATSHAESNPPATSHAESNPQATSPAESILPATSHVEDTLALTAGNPGEAVTLDAESSTNAPNGATRAASSLLGSTRDATGTRSASGTRNARRPRSAESQNAPHASQPLELWQLLRLKLQQQQCE
jgi:hypothetical protein